MRKTYNEAYSICRPRVSLVQSMAGYVGCTCTSFSVLSSNLTRTVMASSAMMAGRWSAVCAARIAISLAAGPCITKHKADSQVLQAGTG